MTNGSTKTLTLCRDKLNNMKMDCMAVDGGMLHLVQRGRGLVGAAARPGPSSLYQT